MRRSHLTLLETVLILIYPAASNHVPLPEDGDGKSACLASILPKLFVEEQVVTYVLGNENRPDFLKTIQKSYYVLNPNNHAKLERATKDKNYVIFLANGGDSPLLNLTKFKFWNPRANYVFVLESLHRKEELFYQIFLFNITKSLLVMKSGNSSSWNVFSYSPYGVNHCGKYNTFLEIGVCNDYIKMVPLQPPKDLRGCSLLAGLTGKVMVKMPLVGDVSSNTTGLYQIVTKFIGGALNLSITFKDIGVLGERILMEKNVRSSEYFNYKEYDVISTFLNRYLVYYQHFDLTEPFFYDDHVWIIAKPKTAAGFLAIFHVFSLESWVAFGIIFVTFSVVWWGISRFYKAANFIETFFLVYTLSLYLSVPFSIKKNPLKILMVAHVFYSMVIFNSFQGKFSSVLVRPGFERGVETVEEMANSKYTPVTYAIFRQLFRETNYAVARKIAEKSVDAAESSEDRILHVLSGNISTPFYKCFLLKNKNKVKILGSDYLMNMEVVYNFRKGSPFLESFNAVISIIHEAGLAKKWLNDIVKPTSSEDKTDVLLTLEYVMCAFYFLIIGYFLGTVALVFEHVSHYLAKKGE